MKEKQGRDGSSRQAFLMTMLKDYSVSLNKLDNSIDEAKDVLEDLEVDQNTPKKLNNFTNMKPNYIQKQFIKSEPSLVNLDLSINQNQSIRSIHRLYHHYTADCNQLVSHKKVIDMNTTFLDNVGVNFIKRCIEQLEDRGLEDEGLYRTGGVLKKVNNLLTFGLNREESSNLNLDDPIECQTTTITSAIKKFLRNMKDPLLTFSLYKRFINAAKLDTKEEKLEEILKLIDQLPSSNRGMLELLLEHLARVMEKSDKNKMTADNLAVCFGPTLLRSEQEVSVENKFSNIVAAVLENKLSNVVLEILIQNWEVVFKKKPRRTVVRGNRTIPLRFNRIYSSLRLKYKLMELYKSKLDDRM